MMGNRPSRREKERKVRRGYRRGGTARRTALHNGITRNEQTVYPRVVLESTRDIPWRWCVRRGGVLGRLTRLPARRWHEVYGGRGWGIARRGTRWRGRQSRRSRATELEDAGRRVGAIGRWRGRESSVRRRGSWVRRRERRGAVWCVCRWWGCYRHGGASRRDGGRSGLRGRREWEVRRALVARTSGRTGQEKNEERKG